MILEPAHEGSAEFNNDSIEVSVRIRLADDAGSSSNEVLEAIDKALHGALVATGYFAVEQILDAWHESRGAESYEKREI